MQSISENDFECLASTGVKSPANAMLEVRLQTGAAPSTGPPPDPLVFAQGLIAAPKSLILSSKRLGRYNLGPTK